MLDFFSSRLTTFFLVIFLFLMGVRCTGADRLVNPVSIVVNSGTTYEQYEALVKETFSTPQFLENLTFYTDIYMQPEEFDYLVEIKKGCFVHADQLIKSIYYLFKKNIFDQIIIEVLEGTVGVSIHFECKAFWTLGRVKIRGLFIDKQKYHHCYGIARGDRFDHEQHERSLEKIRTLCKNEGYFNAQVTSVLLENSNLKTVNPVITITKGRQFVVGANTLFLHEEHNVVGDQKEALQKKIYRTFLKRLIKEPYHKEHLNYKATEIKNYLAAQGYVGASIVLDERVEVNDEHVFLDWRIDIHHKYSFIFWGNRFFSDHQLHQCIGEFGRSAWLVPPSLLAQEIEREYQKKGFGQVSLEIQEEKDRCFFMIKEGERASIEKIVFTHAYSIDQKYIIKNCFGDLVKLGYFDQELLDKGLKAVRELYESRGFLDVAIIGCESEPGSAENSLVIQVLINEGQIKYCTNVVVPAFPELSMKEPFLGINTNNKAIICPQLFQEHRLFLQKYVRDLGFSVVSIEPELRVVNEYNKNDVQIIWHIKSDKAPWRFGKTVVQGAFVYPMNKFMHELHYARDHVWQQDAAKKSFLQLKKRTIFDEIYMFYDHHPFIGKEKTVLFRLHHDDPFEGRLRVGLGFQNVRKYQTFGGMTYKLGGSFISKNPTGKGDIFSIDVDCARSHKEMVLKYSQPWIFNLPFEGLLQLYGIMHDQPGFIGSTKNIYTVIQTGILAGIHKKTIYFDGGFNVGIEGMRTTIIGTNHELCSYVANVARAINFTQQLQNKMVPFCFIEPTLYIDFLDDKINPHRGGYVLFSCKGMVPLLERNTQTVFIKFLMDQAFFVPIGWCVAAFHVRFGHIFHQQFSAIMPTERFYLGGSHSLRGYDADAAPPLGVFINDKGEEQLVPQGGKTMINGSFELRIPVVPRLAGVLFQDVGVLNGNRFADLKSQKILASTGFGVRLHTPLGPLRFDIGFNWHKKHEFPSRFAWFLTFGQAF